jgi:hypothetical protein
MKSGELFVVRTRVEAAIELLVVREHPDGGPWLIVPVDDFPIIGPADVRLPVERPLVARCGHGDWVTREFEHLVDEIRLSALAVVHRKFADLARGRLPDDTTGDDDPEYQEWMGIVAEFMREI